MLQGLAPESEDKPVIQLLTSQFHLVHKGLGCVLCSSGVTLPKWGFEQGEVSCSENREDSGLLWNIETIFDDRLPKKSVGDLAPSFWYNLLEIHMAMANVNNNLIPKV